MVTHYESYMIHMTIVYDLTFWAYLTSIRAPSKNQVLYYGEFSSWDEGGIQPVLPWNCSSFSSSPSLSSDRKLGPKPLRMEKNGLLVSSGAFWKQKSVLFQTPRCVSTPSWRMILSILNDFMLVFDQVVSWNRFRWNEHWDDMMKLSFSRIMIFFFKQNH